MTSCQRPKECEASGYRHGSDPPKQVEITSPTNSRRALSLSSTQFSFRSTHLLSKQSIRIAIRNDVGPHQDGGLSMSPSTITVVVPCVEHEGSFLLHAVNAAIQATFAQPESIQHLFQSACPKNADVHNLRLCGS
jgi:hypothetical protein